MASKDIQVRRDSQGTPDFADDLFERFFGNRFHSLFGDWPTFRTRSMTHFNETDKGYVLSAEIPGIPEEDIEISVRGNMLSIRAEHREESGQEDNDEGYQRHYRKYQQSFALPSDVDPEKIEAQYKHGVLEILLPKTEQPEPRRIQLRGARQ